MKQAQNGRGGRARASQRKSGKGGNPNRNDNRPKGNPKVHLEKYKNLAREALQAGDRILAENYFQFADHYQRLMNEQTRVDGERAADAQNRQQRGRRRQERTQDRPTTAEPEGISDKANGEQPQEVHPELDMAAIPPAIQADKEGGDASGDGETDSTTDSGAKTPRRRSPVRRRRTKQVDEMSAPISSSEKTASSEKAVSSDRGAAEAGVSEEKTQDMDAVKGDAA